MDTVTDYVLGIGDILVAFMVHGAKASRTRPKTDAAAEIQTADA